MDQTKGAWFFKRNPGLLFECHMRLSCFFMEVSLHFKNLLPWDINNWLPFIDSKVRSRNRDPDLSDFFFNIPGVVLNQLLILELINNIKNTELAKYYLANAI